jgi:hypothetical protein
VRFVSPSFLLVLLAQATSHVWCRRPIQLLCHVHGFVPGSGIGFNLNTCQRRAASEVQKSRPRVGGRGGDEESELAPLLPLLEGELIFSSEWKRGSLGIPRVASGGEVERATEV